MTYQQLMYLSQTILFLQLLTNLKDKKKHNFIILYFAVTLFCILALAYRENLICLFIINTVYFYYYSDFTVLNSTVLSLLFHFFYTIVEYGVMGIMKIIFPYQYITILTTTLSTLCFVGLTHSVGYILMDMVVSKIKFFDFKINDSAMQKWSILLYVGLFVTMISMARYQEGSYMNLIWIFTFIILSFSMYYYMKIQSMKREYAFYEAKSNYIPQLLKQNEKQSKSIHDLLALLFKNGVPLEKKNIPNRFVSIDDSLNQVINSLLSQTKYEKIQLKCNILKRTFVEEGDLYLLLEEVAKVINQNSILYIQADDTFKLSTKVVTEDLPETIKHIIYKYQGISNLQNDELTVVLFDVKRGLG